jgi:UDP-N-acetylmuramate dehydrogenase
MEERILKSLCEKGIEYITDENVAMRSTFKIGGVSALSVYPKSVCDLCDAVKILKSAGVKYEIIGNASNMLFAFDRYNGALIFTSGINEYSIDGELVYASCGTSLVRLANAAKENSLSGLEFASGIPARIGGAIAMNAGAHGSQMSDIVEYTDAFDTESFEKIRLYDNGFGYRQSVFLKDKSLICLGAKLNLKKGESIAIAEKMKENNEKRRASQPLELPSAGSYFKRPENDFAGRLIEECGLKGERVGGAEVSPKHAGFIVNVGGANYHDVLSLEKKIKERVASRFGVTLCREVRLVED